MLDPTTTPTEALPVISAVSAAKALRAPEGPRGHVVHEDGFSAVIGQPKIAQHPMAGKRKRRRCTTAKLLGGIQRQIVALGTRIANGETDGTGEDDLAALLELERLVRDTAAHAVERMRKSGMTDRDIGEILGISKQAVQKRWPGHGPYLGTAARFGRRPAPAQEGATDEQ